MEWFNGSNLSKKLIKDKFILYYFLLQDSEKISKRKRIEITR